MTAPIEPDELGAEQPFVSHLVELRDRLIRMLLGVAVALVALFPFANQLYTYVAKPLMARLPEGATMIATQVASPFLTPFKLALVAAVFVTMPWILYQLWAFVAPGLYRHERRLAVPLLVSSIVLFYLGMVFAYFVVFPLVFAFMAGTTPEGVAMMTDISAYLDFVLTLFFAFGVAFEIPIATILLVATGAVTSESLASKRPYVIVGVFVVGMLLTPPDVISQTLLAVPMWALFELGIVLSRVLLRRPAAGGAADDPGDGAPPGGPAGPKSLGGGSGGAARGGAAEPDRKPVPHTAAGPVVGREIDPSAAAEDPERWRPLTDDEMEAELDLMDAQELAELDHAGAAASRPAVPAPAGSAAKAPETAAERVDDKIRRANRLRELDNPFAARQLLYQVLEEGDAGQRQVARNILGQLDEP